MEKTIDITRKNIFAKPEELSPFTDGKEFLFIKNNGRKFSRKKVSFSKEFAINSVIHFANSYFILTDITESFITFSEIDINTANDPEFTVHNAFSSHKIFSEVVLDPEANKPLSESDIDDLIPLEDFFSHIKKSSILPYDGYMDGLVINNRIIYDNDYFDELSYLFYLNNSALDSELELFQEFEKKHGKLNFIWINK